LIAAVADDIDWSAKLKRHMNRRSLLKSTALALAAPGLPLPSWLTAAQAQDSNQDRKWRHGLSLFGDLKYPEGFKQFDYVNAKAPKGGTARQIAIGTFDNFNPVVAGVKGNLAAGEGYIYERLMASAFDEVTGTYGLLAEAVSYPDDRSSVTYRLRPEAKWHDGQPVTTDDVIFSFEAYKKNSPYHAAYYRHVAKIEKTGERDITFTFDAPGNRELPQIVGELNVLPKHWWEGTDANGKKRNIGETMLEAPLGSGPYRVKEFSAGRSVALKRVEDYWGRDLPVNVGTNNFDELRFEYFRDTTVALEAFKADTIDWRDENSAKNWATAYDFPAVNDKRVIKEEFPLKSSGVMQAFAFNIRRAKFADPSLRRAFNLALDFEEMNRQFFYGQYIRIASYFQGLDLAATGLPEGRELELLEAVRDKVPPEVFTTPYSNPVNGTPENVRNNLREALRLLKQAGYEIRNQKLVDSKTGEPYAVELLHQLTDPAFERIILFYKPSLERLGITVTVRIVDESQYENRVRNRDFDMIVLSRGESLSPGNEQRAYWGSQAAGQSGSPNAIGINNPAVDAMIEQIIFAKSRADLVAATKALDRVLLWNHYVVPQWTYPFERTARWDRFGYPDPLPKYAAAGFPTLWWWDADKAAKTGSRS
jgi:microcin C transport system substrate-binding protein